MTDEAHRLMSIFGDNKEHSFFEIVNFGSVLLKKSNRTVEKIFYRSICDNAWVRRLHKSWSPRLDFFQLTPKGDLAYRAEQLARLSRTKLTNDMYRHYKYYTREVGGKWGAEHLGEKLTENEAMKSGTFNPKFGI